MRSGYGKQGGQAEVPDTESRLEVMGSVNVIQRRRKARCERRAGAAPMRVTPRDEEMVRAIWQMRFATCNQICTLLFSGAARSNCQRRLTLLFDHGYIDKVPARAVNSADVYRISRSAAAGLQLLRRYSAGRDLLRRMRAAPQLDHVLAVNDVHCKLLAGCRACGLELVDWKDQAGLAAMGRQAGFIPDGFFVLQRRLEQGVLTAACWLEVERSARGPRAMLRKYTRLNEFYQSGAYGRTFGHRTLRLLVVTSAETVESERRHAGTLAGLAGRAGLRFGLFSSLRDLLGVEVSDVLRAPIWRVPGGSELRPLGELEAPRAGRTV